jgi:hypothetical protein
MGSWGLVGEGKARKGVDGENMYLFIARAVPFGFEATRR